MNTKTCLACNETKPVGDFYERTPGILNPRCKVCQIKRIKIPAKPEPDPKQCAICNQMKPLNEFYGKGGGRKLHDHRCKSCMNAMSKTSQVKERRKLHHQIRYKTDPVYRQNLREQAQKWLEEHPDRHRAIIKRSHEKNYGTPQNLVHRATANAIFRKHLEPAKTKRCVICDFQAEHYHHPFKEAWERRFDVLPVCRKCHCKIHQIKEFEELALKLFQSANPHDVH